MPRHAAQRRTPWFLIWAAVLAVSLSLGVATGLTVGRSASVTATHLASYESPGNRMLDAAETRAGDWYQYGAAGPTTFDCSGLVYWAAGHIGLRNWPRTTYSLAAAAAVLSGRLTYTSHPVRGDLAFYGPGHVEFVTSLYHTTFGAQHTGTRVWWHRWSSYWSPTFYLHVNW